MDKGNGVVYADFVCSLADIFSGLTHCTAISAFCEHKGIGNA